jgi:hypothetical protein
MEHGRQRKQVERRSSAARRADARGSNTREAKETNKKTEKGYKE